MDLQAIYVGFKSVNLRVYAAGSINVPTTGNKIYFSPDAVLTTNKTVGIKVITRADSQQQNANGSIVNCKILDEHAKYLLTLINPEGEILLYRYPLASLSPSTRRGIMFEIKPEFIDLGKSYIEPVQDMTALPGFFFFEFYLQQP